MVECGTERRLRPWNTCRPIIRVTEGGGIVAKCPDCSGESLFDSSVGDGKCSTCNGTGDELDPLEGVGEAMMGLPQTCKECGGSGTCRTCGGDGEI